MLSNILHRSVRCVPPTPISILKSPTIKHLEFDEKLFEINSPNSKFNSVAGELYIAYTA